MLSSVGIQLWCVFFLFDVAHLGQVEVDREVRLKIKLKVYP